ncbi:MAG: amidase family protein [Vulcanimicrobiaceae bacterium]
MNVAPFDAARAHIGDDAIRAWAYIAPDADASSGPLADLACGIKDIIDVAGMPTRFGVDFRDTHPTVDAACVAALRAAGATIVGKTVTTPFAYIDPAPTLNPHDPTRTPGGSSSGSAAAVAAGHVPFALGTQTVGSVLRPASFCGVVGFKPTHGRIATAGVSPEAPSLDHVGVIACDVPTAARVARVLMPDLGSVTVPAAPRLLVDSALFAGDYGDEARVAVEAFAARCAAGGASVVRGDLAPIASRALAALDTILAYEAHVSYGFLRDRHTPPQVVALVRRGALVAGPAYRAALAERETMRPELARSFAEVDAFALICVGPAPGRETTGKPSALGPWSFFGVPALTFPIARSAAGLPIGVQIVAARGRDAQLLALAERLAEFAPG